MSSEPREISDSRHVEQVDVLDEHRLRLVFDDGREGTLDVAEMVSFRGVFARLRDPDFFRRVEVKDGTISWPGEIDFDPDVLHERVTGIPNHAHGRPDPPTPPPRVPRSELLAVPEICRFMGVVIRMYFDDHPKPHFHVDYAEMNAVFAIRSFEMLDGKLPPRIVGLVVEWAALHQDELLENWERLRRGEGARRIAPLDR